ncbi:hypothetical protein [Anabaena sp. CCY 0017]|uniref:hypothetical protein n=1 Tax=Anabaena sp. CCY 0017 TaxID=3103866 RepID=UPI0039C5C36A
MANAVVEVYIATAKNIRTLLIAESLDVGAGLHISSITNNNFNKPAPTWFLRANAPLPL